MARVAPGQEAGLVTLVKLQDTVGGTVAGKRFRRQQRCHEAETLVCGRVRAARWCSLFLMLSSWRRALDRYDALLWALMVLHILLAPHNAGGESLRSRVVHDLLYRGTRWDTSMSPDDLSMPRDMPPNYWGDLLLQVLAYVPVRLVDRLWQARNWALQQPLPEPLFRLLSGWIEPKLPALVLVRCVLGSLSWLAWTLLRHALPDRQAGRYFVFMLGAQFHTIFYASRLWPSTFASAVFSIAYALNLRDRTHIAVALLSFTAAIWHAEWAVFLCWFLLFSIATSNGANRLGWQLCIRGVSMLLGGAGGAALSAVLGSLPKRIFLLPEWEVSSVTAAAESTSEQNVTLPWSWYWTSALPRTLMLVPIYIPLLPLTLVRESVSRRMALTAFAFILSRSWQQHKDLLHMLPVVPLLDAAAAMVLARLHLFGWSSIASDKLHRAAAALNELDTRPYRRVIREAERKRLVRHFVRACQVMLMVDALVSHLGLLGVWRQKAAGAEALRALHHAHRLMQHRGNAAKCPEPHVYIDAGAAASGISPFLEVPGWRYFWNTGRDPDLEDWSSCTHLITTRTSVPGFERVYSTKILECCSIRYPFLRSSERIYVFRRQLQPTLANRSLDPQLLLPGCWPARLPWT